MWEASDMGGEELLWATTNAFGGAAGVREGTCGVVAGAGIYLGLRHRVPLNDREKADAARKTARAQASTVTIEFSKAHGGLSCRDLVGIDWKDAAAVQRFRDSGEWMRKCSGYVEDMIARLYALEQA